MMTLFKKIEIEGIMAEVERISDILESYGNVMRRDAPETHDWAVVLRHAANLEKVRKRLHRLKEGDLRRTSDELG